MANLITERRGVSDTRFAVSLVVVVLAFTTVSLGLIGVASNQQSTMRSQDAQIQQLNASLNSINSSLASNPIAPGSSPGYTLTLLIANNQYFNSTLGYMPRYYVLGPNGLESPANITVPANTLVKLVIVDYDDGGNNMSSQLATVSGTLGNSMLVFNSTSNAATTAQSVSTDGVIAHTFTISALGLNIPVPASSTVVTYVRFDKAGTYTWNCFSPCMPWSVMTSVKGWMTGTFTVG